jgi:hypothetical protein
MPDHIEKNDTNGMQCHEFDSVLSDALDGILSGSQLDRFQAHARSCSACGPLLAEVEAGRNWLKDVSEVNPPADLVTNILASTTGVDSQRLRVKLGAPPRVSSLAASWWERAQAWASGALVPVFAQVWGTVRQPRFAMSFGMAFFSISVALSVLGVKPSDLAHIDLRPVAIRHTYYNTQARVVRYYENIRFVYEVESRVRELKRNVVPAEPDLPNNAPNDSAPDKKEHKNDTTQQPEQKQERNYSQTDNHLVLASARLSRSVNDASLIKAFPIDASLNDPSVVSVTTYRRFV